MPILIVDDSEEAREILTITLEASGYADLTAVASAEAALETLGVGGDGPPAAFDVILLDVIMTGIDGIEACARIRADRRYRDVPILMVTSMNDVACLAQAFVAGANDYVTKPFHRTELTARLRSALRLKGELDRRLARERELRAVARPPATAAGGGIDPVTGFLDRAALESWLRRAARSDDPGPLAALAVAIDCPDAYRRRHGGEAAADVVRRVAAAVGATPARLDGVVAAFGPASFVAVLPGVRPEAAAGLGEALRARVAGLAIRHGDSHAAPVVTASVGVAAGDVGAPDPRRLVAEAVAAADRAAAAGGDRVVEAGRAVGAGAGR